MIPLQSFGAFPDLNPAVAMARFAGPLSRMIAQDRTPLANGANTDFVYHDFTGLPVVGGFTQIPAGLLARNGDMLIAYARYSLSAAVSNKTYQLNLGFTARGVGGFTAGTNIFSSGTATASNDIDTFAYMMRLSATQMAYWATSQLFFSGACQGQLWTTGAMTWANAQNIALSIRDGTGNAAAITNQFLQLLYVPTMFP